MADGVVDHFIDDHPTAGYGVAIIDAEGWQYHVYHMNNDTPGTDDGADDGTWRFLPGLAVGTEVHAGQVIGWMGDSGNSEGSVPHAHVEIHRPDGSPINPFWSLRLAQRDVNCASSTLAATRDISGPDWLTEGWLAAPIDPTWRSLELHGGDHGADLGPVDARMWIGPTGFHPVDGAAVLVGDPAYDEDVDCTALAEEALDIEASIPTELATILATIRTLESGHDYSAESRSSTASGAYQFIDGSWNGFGGYARAKDAPPAVQDAAAALHALSVLARTGGDVSMVPVFWYIGHAPTAEEWDTVPPVGANVLTPREYQARWLDVYGQLVGQRFVPASAPRVGADDDYAACPTRRPVPVPGVELDPIQPAAAQAFGPIPLPLALPGDPLPTTIVAPVRPTRPSAGSGRHRSPAPRRSARRACRRRRLTLLPPPRRPHALSRPVASERWPMCSSPDPCNGSSTSWTRTGSSCPISRSSATSSSTARLRPASADPRDAAPDVRLVRALARPVPRRHGPPRRTAAARRRPARSSPPVRRRPLVVRRPAGRRCAVFGPLPPFRPVRVRSSSASSSPPGPTSSSADRLRPCPPRHTAGRRRLDRPILGPPVRRQRGCSSRSATCW